MDFQQRFGQEGSLEDFRIHPARTLGGFPPNTSLEIQPFSPESQPSDDSHGSKLAISMVGNSSMAAMFHGCVHQHGEGKMELKPRDLTKVPALKCPRSQLLQPSPGKSCRPKQFPIAVMYVHTTPLYGYHDVMRHAPIGTSPAT